MDHDEFEELNPEEQLKVFGRSPIKVRSDLIRHAHDPMLLTQALSCEELYLITREMDPEERSEVIRYASLPQLFFISDIDCWERDRIQPKKLIQWLEILRDADEEKLLAWLLEMDYETVVAGFQKFITVLKPEWEYAVDEQLGDQLYFTLDRMYYILVEEENLETVRRAMEILFENHRGRYTAILEGILSEMEYELEETAYRNRANRLSDQGFPDFETAASIYTGLSKEQFEAFPLKEKDERGESSQEVRTACTFASQYPVLWSLKTLYWDNVLRHLGEEDPGALESVYEQMAWISNKLIVFHGMDLTSEDKMLWAVERTRALLNLGIEILTDRDMTRAVSLLKTRWLESLFRFAVGQLENLRRRMKLLVEEDWNGKHQDLIFFLNPPYEAIFQGFGERVPKCYDFEVGENLEHLRDFITREDLERSERSLRQIEGIHTFLKKHKPDFFRRPLRHPDRIESEGELFINLGTFFAHDTATGKPSFSPLKAGAFERFFEKAFRYEGGRDLLNTEIKEAFLSRYYSPEEQDLMRSLWGLVFQNIQDHLGTAVSRDPASCFWMEEQKDGLMTRVQKKSAASGKKAARKK